MNVSTDPVSPHGSHQQGDELAERRKIQHREGTGRLGHPIECDIGMHFYERQQAGRRTHRRRRGHGIKKGGWNREGPFIKKLCFQTVILFVLKSNDKRKLAMARTVNLKRRGQIQSRSLAPVFAWCEAVCHSRCCQT